MILKNVGMRPVGCFSEKRVKIAMFFLSGMLALPTACISEEGVFRSEQLTLPGKRGAAFTLNERSREENLRKLALLKPYWNYSWGPEWAPRQKERIAGECEFIPMVWGDYDVAGTLRRKILPRIQDGTVKRVMGFNEPDNREQANMTVQRAIECWPAFMEMGVPLVSPSATHPTGDWFREFMEEIERRGYRVDYIGVHWYGGTDVEAFKQFLRRTHEMYGRRPLIITEFAPADWEAQRLKEPSANRHTPARVLAFAKKILPWLEEQDWISGYAWFSFSHRDAGGWSSGLFFPDGSLTALGRYYAGVTKENPKGDQTIEPDDASAFLARVREARERR